MAITALTLAVVGADFPNRRGPTRRFAIALCRPGDPVQLVPEPKNPAAPRAVMVLEKGGVQMGYITAERAPWISGMIRDGREIAAIFQEATEYGALIRVAFDGEIPALPDVPPQSRPNRRGEMDQTPDVDFWPDDSPPDE